MKNKKQNPNIDFQRFVASDDIDMATDVIKGVCNLLNAKELSSGSRTQEDDKNALYALQVALQYGIDEIEALKPNIEYMGNFMRYETITEKEITQ